ncbi:DUF814-domain-containing protein [Suhomyces tanzawaensis NRRL Y-17324]|uniref:DUF814-domain-containing protein n=1 Tax=Suhomyces tanzawaensis NRRL Y-17324 TaxID=984487 RepID=A0A1E4SCS0_9ASCO|nr:DUF814-domain-containing protein [Suhomyces tanzawaensis NRRL Y-17324]ODV77314.1 DUF814-domain-containing protein [Suhomyces tanzawaensis NRRL Y-17324]
MVYYFKTPVNDFQDATIYMGRDKVENDPLIKHSHPKNIWFHVDNYSSAHLYLQLTKEELASYKSFDSFTIDANLLEQLAQLTKANSIKASKLNNITVIYTPVENLHTDGSMDIGTVTFKNPKLVKRVHVTKKDNMIINRLNKSKTEKPTEDFIQEQQQLVRDIQNERKRMDRESNELRKQYELEKKTRADPYGDLFTDNNINASSNEFRNENWVEEEFW